MTRTTMVMVLVLAMLGAACSGADSGEDAGQDSAEPTSVELEGDGAATDDDDVEAADPQGIDRVRLAGLSRFGYPSPFAWVRGPGWIMAGMIFDTLLWEDSTGEPIPWLASDWEQSDDGLTWRFTLQEDATWHDGEPVTADDVVFTVQYMTEGAGAPAAGFAASGLRSVVEEAVAEDEHTVVFTLSRPHAAFLEDVAASVLIVPEHIWADVDDPAQLRTDEATIGSGPYRLESIDEAAGSLLFTAYEDFHLGTPYVRRVEFIPVQDELLALQQGELDAAGTPNEALVPEAQLAAFEADPRLERLDQPGSWNRALHFNLDAGFPYDDVRFRHAIAYAIDREDLVTRILGGAGSPGSTGALAPAHPWALDDLPEYAHDVEEANRLLDELGMLDADGDGVRELPDGEPFTQELLASNRFSSQTPELISEYLREVGIDVTVRVLDQAAADEIAAEGTFSMTLAGYGGLMGDPVYLAERFSSDAPATSFTTAHGYASAQFDELADEQLVTTDPEDRAAMIEEMQRILAEDLPVLSLYVPDNVLFYDREVLDSWYFTPGCSPCGGTRNKHLYVTGQQVGFPE